MGNEKTISDDAPNDEEDIKEGYDEEYGGTGSKDQHDNKPNLTHEGTGFGSGEGDNPGTNGSGKNLFRAEYEKPDDETDAKKIGTMSVRLILSSKYKNVYDLTFVPQKNSEKGFLQIHLSGEQSKVNAIIRSARDSLTGTSLPCQGNKIYLANIQKKQKNKISFLLEYREECAMEVTLYGYSS